MGEAVLIFGIAITPALSGITLLFAWDMRRRGSRPADALCAWIHGLALAQASAPAAVIAAFLLLVATAWVQVGDVPTLPALDFGRAPLGSHYTGGPHPGSYDPWRELIGLTGVTSVVGIVLAPAWFALAKAAGRPVGSFAKLAYYAGWSILVGLVVFDPLGLVLWAFGD